jgi:uncharacterized protein (DUF736 family)
VRTLKFSALWKKVQKDGTPYLSGSVGNDISILVFQNKDKSKENQPDYIVFLDEKKHFDKKTGGNE